MISVIILDAHEPQVIQLTYENLYQELKDIPGFQLLVQDNWFDLSVVKNKFVCFVEPDCLVSHEYFEQQLQEFKDNPFFRKLAMLSPAVGVNFWENRIYGYSLGSRFIDGIIPVTKKKSRVLYPVQIGYVPGALIRTSTLKLIIDGIEPVTDLVKLSTYISLAFWRCGDGNRVYVNPNVTYVTTDSSVNDIGKFKVDAKDLVGKFKKESI
jgi:hypothetical protein